MTIEITIHMGELIDLVEKHLTARGLTPSTPVRFQYATGRSVQDGRTTYINESAAYLVAKCEASAEAKPSEGAVETTLERRR